MKPVERLQDDPADGTALPTRTEILDRARTAVTVDRNHTHGRPEETFPRVARLWSAYLGTSVTAKDVCAMQALLKLARIRGNQDYSDNWVDLAGYAACGGGVAEDVFVVEGPSSLYQAVRDHAEKIGGHEASSESVARVFSGTE